MPLYFDFECSICGILPVLQESWQYKFVTQCENGDVYELPVDYGWCKECSSIVQVIKPAKYINAYLEKIRLSYELDASKRRWIKTKSIKSHIVFLNKKLENLNRLLSLLRERDMKTSCCLCRGLNVFKVEDGALHHGCGGTIIHVSKNDDIRFRMPAPKMVYYKPEYSEKRLVDDNFCEIVMHLYGKYAGLVFGKLILSMYKKMDNINAYMVPLYEKLPFNLIEIETLIDYMNQIIHEHPLWTQDTTKVIDIIREKFSEFLEYKSMQIEEMIQYLSSVFLLFCYNCVYALKTEKNNKKLVIKALHRL